MGTIENKDTIRRIYQALQTGDRSVFGASVHADYVWRFPGHSSWSKCFTGQDEVRDKLLKPLFALFATEYRARAINLVAEGDYVVAEVRGDVQTKRGQRYDNEYCFVFRFRGDKIIVFKKKRRKNHTKRKHGHRQDLVQLRIDSINL